MAPLTSNDETPPLLPKQKRGRGLDWADIKRPRDAEQRPGAWPNGIGMEQDTESPLCGAEYRGTLPGGDVIDTCHRVGTHDTHEGNALRWRSPSYPEGHGLYFRGSAVCWCGRVVLDCPAMNEWVASRG